MDPADYERIAKWTSSKVREELCSAQEVTVILVRNAATHTMASPSVRVI